MQIDSKAQGSIEYLLIIGAAILVVAIVILAITGALNNGTTSQLSTAVSTQGGAWSSITTTYNTAAGYTTQTTNIQQGNYFSIVGRDLTSTPTTLNTAIQNPTNGFTVTVTRNSYTTNYIYTTANGWNPTTANTFNLQIGDQLTGNNPSPTPITINLLGTDKTNDCTNNINILGGTPPLCCTTYPLITPCLRYQLAGLWRFNGDLSDSSGNNLNGTLSSGGNVTYLTGLFGRNYLNSSTVLNTAIIIPTFDNPVNTAALAPGTGSFTVAGWIYYDDPGAGTNMTGIMINRLISGNNSTKGFGLGIFRESPTRDTLFFQLGDGDGTTGNGISSELTNVDNSSFLRKWAYLVGVRDKSTSKAILYFNGTKIMTVPDPTIDISGNFKRATQIGTGTGFSGAFKGGIQEVAVWKRALSQTEINYYYNGGTGRPIP